MTKTGEDRARIAPGTAAEDVDHALDMVVDIFPLSWGGWRTLFCRTRAKRIR